MKIDQHKKLKKRKSIRKKITILLLLSVSSALFLTSLLAIMNLRAVKAVFGEQSQELGNQAAVDAELAMENMAGEHLLNTSVEKAAFIEEKLNVIFADVNGIVQTAERIYDMPEEYPDREVRLPEAGSSKLAAQLLWSKRLVRTNANVLLLPEPTPKEQEELTKLANIQDLLVQYNANNDMISSVYIATKTGWMIQADYIAYSKYSEGKALPDYYEANERQWYIRAMDSKPGDVIYSDVIADVHEGSDCIVCAGVVYCNGEAVAVVGIGSYLDVIYDEVLATTIGDSGYAFLVNEKGKIVASGAKKGETSVSSKNLADLRNSSNTQLAEAAKNMVAGESNLVRMKLENREVYLAYAPLENLGWSFVTVMDRDEVVAPAIDSHNMILDLTNHVSSQVDVSIKQTLISFVVLALFLFILVGTLAVRFGSKISEPIQKLTKEVSLTDGGNLDGTIVLKTGDEVEELAIAFNRMRLQIKTYISHLKQVTAEKERIHTELSVATKIQEDMLPDSDSMLCSNEAFSIYAVTYPAKEVGGDFYDFFMIDKNHLVFLVADVSGKGVPAALFMVMAKSLIENQLMLGKSPAETFESVNSALCRNNRNGMFLTAWMGLLELSSGNLEYVNAGHNCPLWYNAESKEYTWLTEVSGFVLAGMDNMTYEQKHMKLGKGDKIFVYSDGVPEANDETERMFGNEALEDFLSKRTELSPNQLCDQLKNTLDCFQGKAEQFDDITMLLLEYNSDKRENEWSGFPDAKQQNRVAELLKAYLSVKGVVQSQINSFMVAFDEIYSNIRYYSQANIATVKCSIVDSMITVSFEDDGAYFDPTKYKKPKTDVALEEREQGGLGIFMVNTLMDEVTYERVCGLNRLSIQMKKRQQSTE